MKPISMQSEADRAIDVAKLAFPAAAWWRGDVRSPQTLSPGAVFNLLDDRNPNYPRLVAQYRAVTITAAPEGYLAVVAVEAEANPNQIETVRESQVIKSTTIHNRGLMGQIVPAGGR